jgi:BirA family transcriptional regulator, biotin operon repressor / biotin---[acetyl-CoA-carboxylase] ligase
VAQLKPTILRFDSLDSTNLEAMRQAKVGAAEGLCIVAREQTLGRGRLNRTWQSPLDAGLYFSIVLRPKLEKSAWPLLTLMSALAVSDALARTCGLRTDIKWPNDLCFGERKLCGILAETVETGTGLAAIVGIGINLTADGLPEAVRYTATSVESVTGAPTDKARLLELLVKAIDERYDLLQTPQGREHTIREWCANSSYAIGRQVRVAVGNDTFEGTTRGLESDGALRVETKDGRIRIVRAGDVTSVRRSG